MIPWLTELYGNPSGSHQVARRARAAVDDARDRVAAFMGVDPGGVVFTSGGTEADNLAVLGPLAIRTGAVVISAVEHPGVFQAARASGREVRIAGVGSDGVVDQEALRKIADADVAVVSIQLVNHETGVVQPISELAPRIHKWAPNAVFHVDAVQGAPWLRLSEASRGADLISISAHKIGGPQGIGALGIRSDIGLAPITYGGGQERERRSGSHNVAAIAGLGAAVAVVDAERDARVDAVTARRDWLARAITGELPEAVWTAESSRRTPGHLHVRFPGVESEALLFKLDEAGVCASAGAACASGALEPSPVLLAMGVDKQEAGSSLRLTLGPSTTSEEIEEAASIIVAAVRALR
jgi:cysteine desulfurase